MRVSILPPVCSTTGDAGGSYCGDDIDGRCLEAAGGSRRSAGGCHIRCVNLTSNTQQLLSTTDGSHTGDSSSGSSRAAQQMMPNNLSLFIASLEIFLTKYAWNGNNPDVNINVAKVAALAAEEARKRLPIHLTAKGMPSSSLPILIALLHWLPSWANIRTAPLLMLVRRTSQDRGMGIAMSFYTSQSEPMQIKRYRPSNSCNWIYSFSRDCFHILVHVQ